MTNTTSANWTQLNAGSTTGQTLGTADATTYYYADANLTFTNSNAGGSGLTILGTVYLYVPQGVTLTCTGANADGQTGGGAGIELTEGNTLNLLGSGTFNATGGNAANGGNGGNGNNAECTYDESILGGSGGTGGNGGGGAGAGIGTRGANGGNGGTGGQRNGSYGQETTQYGVDGNAGSGGSTAGPMGTLYKTNDITVNATGGSAGSNGTGGNRGLTASQHPGSNVYMASGGGGGGAGGFGGAASDIGTGGPGGGGGGGGAAGNVAWVLYSGTDNGYYHAGACGGNGGKNADGSSAPNGADVELTNPKYADIQAGGLRSDASDYSDDAGWENGNGRHAGGAGGAAGSASTSESAVTVTMELPDQNEWDMACRMTNTSRSGWTALPFGGSKGITIGTAGQTTYYFASGDRTFTNSAAGGSGLTILGTVYLFISSGQTITCTGTHAYGTTGAGAGVELTAGNTLYLIGSGTMNATGGNAASGGNGQNGDDAYLISNNTILGGSGGRGGDGGGGAGAGIGTRGGNGGNGGIAPEKEIYYKTWTQNGVVGGDGSSGQTAGAKGELHVSKDITINATGGSQGSAGTAGSAGKSCMRYGGNEYSIPGGGGGGAGGFGGAANNIGPGGPGGGGGGGGAKGSHDRTSTGFYIIYANGGGGGQNGDGSYAASGGTAGVSTANINNGTCDTNDLSWVQAEERGKESSDVNTTTNGGAGGACGTSIINDVVSSETTTMTSGTYTVLFDVTVQSRIQISGNVTLNLGEGAMLTANKGIEVSNGNSLTINGPGALTVPGADLDKAGIGALRVGTLTINGGTIDVTGGEQAAGIGGDGENRDGGTIIINGGVVTAKGLKGGAGIGGGDYGGWYDGRGRCGTVVINGGQVTAIGYGGAAGIGPGHIPGFHTYTNEGGSLTIGWTRLTDFVYSSGYSNNDNLGLSSIVFADGKRFMIEETGVGATSGNIAGKKIVPIPETELSGSGAENDPYLINDPDDWYLLFAKIAQGTSYSGQFVQLNSDISVSTMVGISETNSFQGTFLGDNKTLTFTKGSAESAFGEENCAPFRYVKNATIQNLKVAGDIYTSNKHAAGLACRTFGTTNIIGCQVGTLIYSSVSGDGTHGGIVAMPQSGSTLNIEGCVYDGHLLTNSGTNSCGGFVGWHNGATISVSNSLYAPASSIPTGWTPITGGTTFVRGGNPTITGCCYTETMGGAQGTQCSPVVVGLTILGEQVKEYSMLKVYQYGFFYDGTCYMIPVTISLADNADNSTTISNANAYAADVTIAGRIFYRDGGWNTLCLPFDAAKTGPLTAAFIKELDTETAYDGHKTGFEDDTLYLNFKDAERIVAGRPYIVKWTAVSQEHIINPSDEVFAALDFITEVPAFDGGLETTWEGEVGPDKLVDGNTSTSYGLSNDPWVEFHYAKPITPKGYALMTSDGSDYNPKSWTIKAKNSGDANWTTLTTVDNTNRDKLPAANNQWTVFKLDNSTAYQYFRFEAVKNYRFKLAELQFCNVQPGSTEIVNPTFEGVNLNADAPTAVTSDDGKVSFTGCYSPVSIDGEDNTMLYLGAGNTLYYPNAAMTIGAFRAHFTLNGIGDPNAGVRAFKLNFGDDDNATGIISVHDSGFMVNGSDAWYSLDGRKLDGKPTQRGIYINNGKKTIIK